MKPMRARVGSERLAPTAVAGSAVVHALFVFAVFGAGQQASSRVPLPAYRVDLVAAPRPAAPAEDVQAPTPAVAEPPRPVAPPRERAATRTPPSPTRAAERTPPAAAEPTRPGPTGTGGAGAEPATIRTEGVDFPFPGYLRNLVAQIYRRWRPPDGNANLEAEIFFFINRDGSMSGLQFVRRSGSFGFDLEAQGAVEAAARAGVFGPLPAGYGADVLPVSFFFSPRAVR